MKPTILAQAIEARAASETFDLAKQATPLTMTGYALVVIVLFAAVWVLYKLYIGQKEENRQESRANREFTSKHLEVMVSVKQRLDDQQPMRMDISDLKNMGHNLLKGQEEIKSKLDRTRTA